MGQTTGQIEAQIENRRAELGSNLQELENKMKSVTDWKRHVRENPVTMLGVAFGGGILLASMSGGNRKRRRENNYAGPAGRRQQPHAATEQQSHKALETWDHIKGALIGVAATRFRDFVGELVPGFQEQYQKTEQTANKQSLNH